MPWEAKSPEGRDGNHRLQVEAEGLMADRSCLSVGACARARMMSRAADGSRTRKPGSTSFPRHCAVPPKRALPSRAPGGGDESRARLAWTHRGSRAESLLFLSPRLPPSLLSQPRRTLKSLATARHLLSSPSERSTRSPEEPERAPEALPRFAARVVASPGTDLASSRL